MFFIIITLFNDWTSVQCGKGFHACSSEQQDEAAIACDFLRSDKYAECIKGVSTTLKKSGSG